MTRAEHLAWAKARALEYFDPANQTAGNRCNDAVASMISDMDKHPELVSHPGLALWPALLFGLRPATEQATKHWIEGFN